MTTKLGAERSGVTTHVVYDDKARGWTVRGYNPGRVSRASSTLLVNKYHTFFPGVKLPERKVNHSPPSSEEIKNK
jgi:hypothetical protein